LLGIKPYAARYAWRALLPMPQPHDEHDEQHHDDHGDENEARWENSGLMHGLSIPCRNVTALPGRPALIATAPAGGGTWSVHGSGQLPTTR